MRLNPSSRPAPDQRGRAGRGTPRARAVDEDVDHVQGVVLDEGDGVAEKPALAVHGQVLVLDVGIVAHPPPQVAGAAVDGDAVALAVPLPEARDLLQRRIGCAVHRHPVAARRGRRRRRLYACRHAASRPLATGAASCRDPLGQDRVEVLAEHAPSAARACSWPSRRRRRSRACVRTLPTAPPATWPAVVKKKLNLSFSFSKHSRSCEKYRPVPRRSGWLMQFSVLPASIGLPQTLSGVGMRLYWATSWSPSSRSRSKTRFMLPCPAHVSSHSQANSSALPVPAGEGPVEPVDLDLVARLIGRLTVCKGRTCLARTARRAGRRHGGVSSSSA